MPRYGLPSMKVGGTNRRRTVTPPRLRPADQGAPGSGEDNRQEDVSPPAGAALDDPEAGTSKGMDNGDGGDTAQHTDQLTSQITCCVLKDEDNFIQNVGQFYNQQDISDAILKVGGEIFYAHKFVLAKSSEVFRTMLYDRNWTQSQKGLPEIELEETEECQKHFGNFLKFLYTAEVNISVDSAVGILCLADKYSVISLKNLCTQYMVEHTRSPLVKNALSWYAWSKALHLDELISQCSKTIAWNAEFLLSSPEWLDMDVDFVRDVLENSDLVITNEYTLFLALKLWLGQDTHERHFRDYSKQLLPLIRFPQMHVTQLFKIEQCEMFQEESLMALLLQLINRAYRFRSLCPQQSDPDIDVSFREKFYEPRNYLDLSVDTVRMQNTLRFGIQVDVRTYVGPVPSLTRDGEWKITYRKTNDTWTLQIYCHESALVGGEAHVQATLIITNQDDRVIQVEESEPNSCSRGNHLTMGVRVPDTIQAKSMAVLLKPLPK